MMLQAKQANERSIKTRVKKIKYLLDEVEYKIINNADQGFCSVIYDVPEQCSEMEEAWLIKVLEVNGYGVERHMHTDSSISLAIFW